MTKHEAIDLAAVKQTMRDTVAAHYDEVQKIVRTLYDHPEIGGQEYMAHDLLTDYMAKAGFDVTPHVGMETGFTATYGDPASGPCIALCAEFDALPGVGHGCGHNLFAGFSLLAATALAPVVDAVGGSILLAGTPAEENLGGKIKMADAGVFDDVDAALMLHPSTKNGVGSMTQALNPIKFDFYGTSAHGCKPWEGQSALDAAVLTYTAISMLRQFAKPGTFIHGIMKDGGDAANTIPEHASLEYYFRAAKMAEAEALTAQAVERAKGAAAACGCTVETSVYECPYEELLYNETLADMLKDAFEDEGLTDIEPFDPVPSGSSDVGAVSFLCPTVHGNIKIADESVNGHSKEMADATVSEAGDKALSDGAHALCTVALRLLTEPEMLAQAQADYAKELEASKA